MTIKIAFNAQNAARVQVVSSNRASARVVKAAEDVARYLRNNSGRNHVVIARENFLGVLDVKLERLTKVTGKKATDSDFMQKLLANKIFA